MINNIWFKIIAGKINNIPKFYTIFARMNVCWNSVYRRVFGFHRWESVKCFICGLGKLNFIHIHMQSVLRFLSYGF